MEDMCNIGELTLTECHKTVYVKNRATENICNLSNENIHFIKLKIEKDDDISTICLHHKC